MHMHTASTPSAQALSVTWRVFVESHLSVHTEVPIEYRGEVRKYLGDDHYITVESFCVFDSEHIDIALLCFGYERIDNWHPVHGRYYASEATLQRSKE